MTLGASSFIENRFQDAVTLDEGFYRLPQRLQDKILPPFVLTEQEKVRQRLLLSNAQVHTLEEMQAQHGQAIKAKADSTANPAQGVGEAAQTAAAPAAALCGLAPTPLTNRGVKSQDGYSGLPSFEALEKLKLVAMGKGKYQAVSIPLPDKSKDVKHSFVDWVNFTFKVDLFPIELNTGHPALGDEDYITALSLHLHDIFGYGITRKRESGLNFYHHSYDLGFNGWGIVCIGGQNGTVLVTVKGQGLMSAKVGWELRLKRFLQNIPDAKITRVDLAHDSFNSEVSLNDYLEMYRAGLFNGRGCPPEVECHGNWEKPNGKGRTLYIGSRQSGRYLRIYEKGLQLAKGYHEQFPDWVRVELELKNDGRIIPFDVLTRPGQYLAGAYPALSNMHEKQERIQSFRNTVKSTFERSLEITRTQFGKYIFVFVETLGADEAIKRLTEGKDQLPKNLIFDTHENFNQTDYIHTDAVKITTIEDITWHSNPYTT